MPSLSSFIFAQVTNATNAAAGAINPVDAAATQQPVWANFLPYLALAGVAYFLFIRPQSVAAKKQKETIGGAKTGDKVVMTNGIHGVISNVKDTTFVVKIADNVKIEVEKSVIDKVTRASAAEPVKA
jgi:preprotein translocase subunit YajC